MSPCLRGNPQNGLFNSRTGEKIHDSLAVESAQNARGVAALLCLNAAAHAQTADDAATAIDKLVSKAYPADGPGASVIVIKEGRTLLRKGYGMADMELAVRVEPDMLHQHHAKRPAAFRRARWAAQA